MCTNTNEFDINTFVPNKNYVIDASAGTGKTYTIVEIVKKLLQSNVTLDKILIVTYTDKAAGELKDRVRKGINQLIADGILAPNEKNNVDTASIGTIHSFCENAIKEYFISAGKPSDQKLIDEDEVKNFVKRHIRQGNIYDEIINYKQSNPADSIEEKLVETITAYIKQYYLNNNGNEVPGIIAWENNVHTNNDFIHKLTYTCLAQIYKQWQLEKSALSEQTFDDMIRNVREEVVNGGPLLQKIRDKYTCAIIDEFQDTNQKQWGIFKTVFLDDAGHHIIVVGDPKQSIYAFQGADVTVYKKAKDEIIASGGVNCTLSANYRARKPMITAINNFFDQTKNAFALPNHPPFVPLVPSKCGNTQFAAQYDGKETPAFWITDGTTLPEEYAEIVCQRIVDSCTIDDNNDKTKLQVWDKDKADPKKIVQRNVSFRDFAVLARSGKEMEPITKAFEKYGIPYVRYKDASLFKGKECADWIAVLEAVNCADFSGRNQTCLRKAMLTYFFGHTLNSVCNADFDTVAVSAAGIFAVWREYAQNKEWQKLIERIITDTGVAGKMKTLSDVKAYGVLMQIGDYCAEYLARTGNLDGLIYNLQKQAKGSNDEDAEKGSDIIAKSTDADCVQVMTIHASKGLEFPVVISVSGFKRSNTFVVHANTYHESDGHWLTFAKNQQCKTEAIEEEQRLYYVAYTRAKYILMLPEYPVPRFGRNPDKTRLFISQSIVAYRNSYPGQYRPLSLYGGDINVDAMKKAVQKICGYNATNVTPVKEDEFDKRIADLKDFGKSIYFHSSPKHAYSSLSHGGEDAAKPADEDDVTAADSDVIENDKYQHNNEDDLQTDDAVAVTGLGAFDNDGRQILCDYVDMAPADQPKDFPAGTDLGDALHRVFEQVDYVTPGTPAETKELIERSFDELNIHHKDKSEWIKYVQDMIDNVLGAKLPVIKGNTAPGGDFSLSEIKMEDRKNEVEFNFDILKDVHTKKDFFHHYMNGFVDLIFRRGDKYSILDWKSDRLNDDDFTSYSDHVILKKHVDKLYAIQRVLYSYTLVKWLEQFYPGKMPEDIFKEHFGGIYYVFLRGCNAGTGNGVYAQTWESFAQLKKAYDNIVGKKVFGQ